VLQPLGSAGLVEVTVWQLAQCVDGIAGYSPLTQAFGNGQQLVLQAADCKNLLSLDPFWVAQSQALSKIPASFVVAHNGNVDGATGTGLTVSSTQVQSTSVSNSASSTYTTKVSSVVANTYGLSASVNIPLGSLAKLGFTAGFSNNTTTTMTGSLSFNFQSISATTLSQTNYATTAIADSCFSKAPPPKPGTPCYSVPVVAYLDLAFLGLAVTDSAMNYPVPNGGGQNTHIAEKLPNASTAPAIPDEFKGLAVVCQTCRSASLPAGTDAKPRQYLKDTGNGYIAVTEPTPQQQAAAVA
jgi:hypothetical protein